jgi:MraZ protein
MFKGSFIHTLDSKGRLAIPKKLRSYMNPEAEDTFVMTLGMSGCIELFPKDYWSKHYEKRLENLDIHNQKQGMYIRRVLEYAREDTMDRQWRINIPNNLIELAGLKGEVLLLGVLNQIEVWNPETYEDYKKKFSQPLLELQEEVWKEK